MAAGMATDGWKRSLEHYRLSAVALYSAMEREGFNPGFPVPVDPNGELLGGAHRLACALVLGIKDIPVDRRPDFAWAPAWDEDWFRRRGLDEARIESLKSDLCAYKTEGARNGGQEEGQGRQVLTRGRWETDSRRLPDPRLGPIEDTRRDTWLKAPQ